jgi:hypothetical protein
VFCLGDAPSEVMSGSTISRVEESARLKDLEETFEERYTKVMYHVMYRQKSERQKEFIHDTFIWKNIVYC